MNSTTTSQEILDVPGLTSLDLDTEYRSSREEAIAHFFGPCLSHSVIYRRAVGYFKSSVFSVIGREVAHLALRGGKIKLICSPNLSPEDIDSIALGHAQKSSIIPQRLTQEIEELFSAPSSRFNLQMLALLVSAGSIEIKIAMRADSKGLYHEKIGIFEDAMENLVTFKGSSNETWSGWHPSGNFESIEVFCSWREGREAIRVNKHFKHFNRLWSEKDEDVEVFPFPVDAKETLKRFAMAETDLRSFLKGGKLTKKRKPMPHQLKAIWSWKTQGKRGVLQHATGSGKTFTAIAALKEHVELGKPCLILVPSRLLLEQWLDEVSTELPSSTILAAGGGHNNWRTRDKLASFSNDDSENGQRVIVATMQTASSENFRKALNDGDHIMVVADEVHQIGSPRNSKFFEVNCGPRLGLSATPERYGDPEGTAKIIEYFGPVVEPIISLEDAIEAGRLVKYKYFPHIVNLTAGEAEEWNSISKQIKREIARSSKPNQPLILNERAKILLIQRSRIAKKATNKVALALEVIRENFFKGESWLIYCEDREQLDEVVSVLNAANFDTIVYHSEMEGDRDATMSWFREFGGILVSIRCLDEGVDIPDVSHALILASSQNPRQFIQRRGRVLRKAPHKHIATIHDAIVVPIKGDDEDNQMNLLKSELARAIEFADHAINQAANAQLREIAIDMGIEVSELTDIGLEEEDYE
jgi:superfamily II DNA or RNA helicase